ncbi:MAG TPA: hypothetical protein VKA68_07960 [bacterium]|nr:hypothetical protein [bacterium]
MECRHYKKPLWVFLGLVSMVSALFYSCQREQAAFNQALENGRLANEGFRRCVRYTQDWLNHADPESGLIPRNLNNDRDIWNASDAAADNYPFMVLTASIADEALFQGRMRDMLESEAQLTSRLGHLPDTYSFSTNAYTQSDIDTADIIFGASEYIKDGLLPLTEWLGSSPWSNRLLDILDDIWYYAPVSTRDGAIPSTDPEINGEMLQTLSRIYWMTDDEKYLRWAIRLGDYYLLGDHHPTRDFTQLRLRDHGCEIVSGLCELYATLHDVRPGKQEEYREPLHAMLDRVLEVGRNEYGLFYDVVDPRTGEVVNEGIADTWGYTYNGYYTVYLIDSTEAYRQAVLDALESLHEHYVHYDWESGSADGDADAIESALNLYNREPLPSVAGWIDNEIQYLWSKQDSAHRPETAQWRGSGIIEGWHGDGNFARTTIMYSLWKTQGLTIRPWRQDVIIGAVYDGNNLNISATAEKPWNGQVRFDVQRHRRQMHLPLDWPRINQFPEWFTVEQEVNYECRNLNTDSESVFSGQELQEGLSVELQPGEVLRLQVRTL